MESIYLISDFSNKIKRLAESLQLPAQNIISYQYKENESGYHTWLNDEFKAKEIDKIIIPVSISNDDTINTIGLLLGLHIRLNYELSLEKRLIPIIFLSNFTVENLIKVNSFDSDNNPQNLIFTKGVYFSSFDIEDIQKTIISSTPCLKADYYKNVLSKLNINRKEALGGHDIANAWGCFKVAQVVGFDDRIFQLYPIAKHLKQLYAKNLICKNQTFSNEKRIDLNPIKCNGKKILFIDDKADEGWAELIKNLFRGAGDNFKYVDSSKYKADDLHKSFKDFDGFYKECQSHIGKDWDLIIIDLRLNPEKEDIDNELTKPTDFSGYKLIDEFLTKNEGYQIIVLTASNKIWNINAALKRGAYSYFIKESPEFNFPISETKKLLDKFKNDVKVCFHRGYLKQIFKEKDDLIHFINEMEYGSDFLETLKNQLNLAYYLLSKAETNEQFAYAYVSLYMIIETINNHFVVKTTNDVWVLNITNEPLLDWSYDAKAKSYINTNTTVFGSKPPEWQKLAGLHFQNWNGQEQSFVQKIYQLITKRNGFIHNDKSILDKTKKDKNGEDVLDNEKKPIYLNHDIYKPEGFIELFKVIQKVIGSL
ncbi:MAG: response regulator [Algoriphagus sp.]|uniref:response regulator n=1 Tax=Algoriphagus sp. TaxID=1872435 RepID=UPI003298DDBB